MKREIIESVAAANADQVQKAQEQEPSKVEMVGDTAVQLDSAGDLIEGIWVISGHAASGLGAVVQGVGDLLDAIPTLD